MSFLEKEAILMLSKLLQESKNVTPKQRYRSLNALSYECKTVSLLSKLSQESKNVTPKQRYRSLNALSYECKTVSLKVKRKRGSAWSW